MNPITISKGSADQGGYIISRSAVEGFHVRDLVEALAIVARLMRGMDWRDAIFALADAKDPETGPARLRRLAEDTNPAVLAVVAIHPKADLATLAAIASKGPNMAEIAAWRIASDVHE